MNIKHRLDLETLDLEDKIDWESRSIYGTFDINIDIPDATILMKALDIIKKANITEFEDEQNEILEELIKDFNETERMELCELSYPPLRHTNLAEQILLEKLEDVWRDMQNGKFTPQQIETKLQELLG